ncbi:AraC family transcriptional regulator [Ahrensia marina]|uniref:AraC family transcriptional regulator n=1 Tax=Ahrensia marina TaxID=1514904 RepID=UPI0006B46B34|nr:AraC family transcriptional regulator [Ahrensia marina]
MIDVLSDVLNHLNLRSVRCSRLEASGAWSLRFSLRTTLKFVAVMKGEAWLIPDEENPVHLCEGDAFFLSNAAGYVVASDATVTPMDGLNAFDWDTGKTGCFGGDDTIMLGGGFDVHGGPIDFLLKVMPKVIQISAQSHSAKALRLSLSLLDSELENQKIGSDAASKSLADVMLVHALRAYAFGDGFRSPTWLNGLAHPKISRALAVMHGNPEYGWKVEDLARAASMSRSSFARIFAEKVGLPPLAYLTQWRLERACAALRQGVEPISGIAQASGYGSESAFGLAFKRQLGISPGRYRKDHGLMNPEKAVIGH